MRSTFGLLITFVVFVLVVGSGALIWYLSDSAEFSRRDAPAAESSR